MSAQLIVFPRGQLDNATRDELLGHGFLAVEADDPSKVVTVIPGAPLAGASDMFMSALQAVSAYGAGQKFAEELLRRLKAREQETGSAI